MRFVTLQLDLQAKESILMWWRSTLTVIDSSVIIYQMDGCSKKQRHHLAWNTRLWHASSFLSVMQYFTYFSSSGTTVLYPWHWRGEKNPIFCGNHSAENNDDILSSPRDKNTLFPPNSGIMAKFLREIHSGLHPLWFSLRNIANISLVCRWIICIHPTRTSKYCYIIFPRAVPLYYIHGTGG